MRYATIRIRQDTEASMQEVRSQFLKAWNTEEYQGETFEFESPAALFRLLTPKRWELVEKLQGAGEISLRGLARLLGRDVRRVWDDVHALLDSGIVEKNDGGKLFVPYAIKWGQTRINSIKFQSIVRDYHNLIESDPT